MKSLIYAQNYIKHCGDQVKAPPLQAQSFRKLQSKWENKVHTQRLKARQYGLALRTKLYGANYKCPTTQRRDGVTWILPLSDKEPLPQQKTTNQNKESVVLSHRQLFVPIARAYYHFLDLRTHFYSHFNISETQMHLQSTCTFNDVFMFPSKKLLRVQLTIDGPSEVKKQDTLLQPVLGIGDTEGDSGADSSRGHSIVNAAYKY